MRARDALLLAAVEDHEPPAIEAKPCEVAVELREALRERIGRRLRGLLWYPERPPPRAEWPPLLDLALEPMIAFANRSLTWWIEQGDPAKDELFLHWYSQMMRAWRQSGAELLNLDSPEQEWPFETEGRMP